MDIISLVQYTLAKVIETFAHNWWLLLISILIGAALAFLITGAGTSIGALGGALSIARWRVIGIVVGTLWALPGRRKLFPIFASAKEIERMTQTHIYKENL